MPRPAQHAQANRKSAPTAQLHVQRRDELGQLSLDGVPGTSSGTLPNVDE